MLRYVGRRLVSLAVSLLVASVVIFLALEVVPGDPAAYMLGINAQEDTLAALRAELGLDQSRVERYFSWVGGMVQGDFGTSYTYRTPVAEMIGDRLWVSLPLAVYALVLSTLIAFPAGIWAASRRGSPVDWGVMGVTQLGVAIPNFWFAMLMVLVFAINLRWFSAGGFAGWENGLLAGMKSLTLPAIALALTLLLTLAGHLGLAFADLQRQRATVETLRAEASELLARNVPGARVTDDPRLLYRRLAAGGQEAPGFLAVLARASEALAATPVQLSNLNWSGRDAALTLEAEAQGIDVLQAAEAALRAAALDVAAGAVTAGGGSARMTLTVRSAQ